MRKTQSIQLRAIERGTSAGALKIYPSINARITGPFMISILVVAAIGIFVITNLVAGSVQERFNNQLIDSAQAANNAITDIERQSLAVLRLMVYTEGVDEAFAVRNVAALDRWLRPVAANHAVDDVIFFDSNGQTLLQLSHVADQPGAVYDDSRRLDVTGWRSVQNIIGRHEDELGDKYVEVVAGEDHSLVYFSAPVVDAEGRVVGGISLGLKLDRLAIQVREQSLSAVTLYTAEGQVLGSTFGTSATDEITLTLDQAARLMVGVQRVSPVEKMIVRGTEYQMMFVPLALRGQQIGLLAVALPNNFIVERASTSRNVFGLLFSILFVSVGLVGLLIARTITRPIDRLVNTTRAIREGDLTRRVGLQMPDELGELGQSFDHMTDQLVQRNHQINELYLQQVQETAQRQAVLVSISDAVIVRNLQGEFVLKNHTANRLLEQLNHNPHLWQEFTRLLQNLEELVQPRTVTFFDQVYSVMATPVKMPGEEEILGHVIVCRDITPIMEVERLKEDLIMQMSHELRTPLASARGYIDLLKVLESSSLSNQGMGFLTGALHNLSVLERMVSQVIDVSAVFSNHFRLNLEVFDLAELLTEQVKTWQLVATERKQLLSLYPCMGLWVEADRQRLEQVIDHLLRNAHSYTLPGGMVEICADKRNGRVTFQVFDTGVGIAPDEVDKVFERMYRGKSADAGPTDSRGLGLGLYLCKRIVEAHHGSISLESVPNAFTRVTVELPVSRDQGNPY